MSWYEKLWQRLVDKFVDYWLEAAVVALATATGFYVKDWLFSPIPVWPIVIIIVVMMIIVMSHRLYKLRPRTFKQFEVFEKGLNVVWWVRRNPSDWSTSVFDPRCISDYTSNILDGPYCGVTTNSGELCLGHFYEKDSSQMSQQCSKCGRYVFVDEDKKPKRVKVTIPELKLVVLQELQNEIRRNKRLKRKWSFDLYAP